MASIQTAIRLNDQMTAPLMSIVNAINMTVASMYDMQDAVSHELDTTSLDSARNAAVQAQIAIEALNQTANRIIEPQIEQPEPVVVPVKWQTDNLDVFTETGIGRFNHEVISTNQMLNTLSNTQSEIAQKAQNTDIFSDSAIMDISTLGQRIQTIQDRIHQIERNPLNMGTDRTNTELEQLRSQLSQAINLQNTLNSAVDNMDVEMANEAYLMLSRTVGNTERYIRDNVDAQGNFNQQIQKGTEMSNDLVDTIKNLATAYFSLQTLGKVIGISDEITQTKARLDMMNDGAQTTDELFNQVYQSAQRSRGSVGDMADVVARFGNNAKAAFGSNTEVIQFAEIVQKQMTIAGASTTEASNAMLQLSQALGSGILRGDELNSIFEQAPNLIQSIADYLDVPIGQIREMASEGKLSADVVKAAIFASADEVNAKFEEMPMTWGQVWQQFQNSALIAFEPVLNRINDLANNDSFQSFVDSAINALVLVSNAVISIFEAVASVGNFVSENWSVIEPIIMGIVTALGLYYGAMLAYNTITGISTAITSVKAFAGQVHAASLAMEAGATFAATAAQYGFNAALLACPITWIIALVIALIAILIAVAAHIAKTGDVATTTFGVIAGALAVLGAFVINAVIGVVDGALQIVWSFITPFIGIIEWILNACRGGFDSFGGAVANLIGQIISWFLDLFKVVSKVIDAIFGSNWSEWLNNLQDKVLEWGKTETAITLNRDAPTVESWTRGDIQRIEYGDAYAAGAAWGDGISNKVSDMFGSDMESILPEVSSIASNTASVADSLDVTNEDLKYMRDLAEQETINRFTTAEVRVDLGGVTNNVNSNMDLDGVVDYLTTGVQEAMERIAEGVH